MAVPCEVPYRRRRIVVSILFGFPFELEAKVWSSNNHENYAYGCIFCAAEGRTVRFYIGVSSKIPD